METDMSLRLSYEYLARTSCFFCLYAVPNIKWLTLYMSVYILTAIIITAKFADFDNPVFNETLSAQPGYMLGALIVFHITQSQRLNRFFKQNQYKQQSEQMSEVLDSQNDAIIAYENIDESCQGLFANINFLFSNTKCFQLFNYDFSRSKAFDENRSLGNETDYADSPLDLELFVPQNFG